MGDADQAEPDETPRRRSIDYQLPTLLASLETLQRQLAVDRARWQQERERWLRERRDARWERRWPKIAAVVALLISVSLFIESNARRSDFCAGRDALRSAITLAGDTSGAGIRFDTGDDPLFDAMPGTVRAYLTDSLQPRLNAGGPDDSGFVEQALAEIPACT